MIGEKKIYSLQELGEQIKKTDIEIAILTIPNKVAQDVADFAVKSGIKYIWNFAPTIIKTPDNVKVWNENLIGSFLQFCAIENIC